jgi:hypothetical protein
MKKLFSTLLVALACSAANAQFVHTNYAAVDAYDITGNFDSYNWIWFGQDSQSVMFDVDFSSSDADLSSATLGWKMSRNTSTGKVDYVIISNTNITSTGTAGRVTFSVTNTAVPPDNTYLTELYAYLGAATNTSRTLAQGIVDVRQSLYENDSLFSFPNTTGLVEYVRKDGDFTQFTGLVSSNNYVWVTTGSGGGQWQTNTVGDITGVTATNPITGGGTSGAIGIGFDGTQSFNASGATNLNGTEIRSGMVADARIASTIARDSEVASAYVAVAGDTMSGDLGMGGNDVTNAASVSDTYKYDLANGYLERIDATFGDITLVNLDTQKIYVDNKDGTSAESVSWSNRTLVGGPWEVSSAPSAGDDIVDVEYADSTYINTAGDTMAGNLAMGGNNITGGGNYEADTVELDGTTNVTMSAITVNGTNYIAFILTGSSVTNLMALEY